MSVYHITMERGHKVPAPSTRRRNTDSYATAANNRSC